MHTASDGASARSDGDKEGIPAKTCLLDSRAALCCLFRSYQLFGLDDMRKQGDEMSAEKCMGHKKETTLS
jgi:hypothetical protein